MRDCNTRQDCIPLPWVSPAVCSARYMAGCSWSISLIRATSRSERVHVSLKAAPTAALPSGAA